MEIVLFGCEGHIVLGWCCWRLGRFEPEAQQMSLERPELVLPMASGLCLTVTTVVVQPQHPHCVTSCHPCIRCHCTHPCPLCLLRLVLPNWSSQGGVLMFCGGRGFSSTRLGSPGPPSSRRTPHPPPGMPDPDHPRDEKEGQGREWSPLTW